MTAFSKHHLRRIRDHLVRVQQTLVPRPTPEVLVDVADLLPIIQSELDAAEARLERGEKILEWRLSTHHAPTQNELMAFTGRRFFLKKRIAEELDRMLRERIEMQPRLIVNGPFARLVRVTRFTSAGARVDDAAAADAIGGKMPIDALVRAGILHDDSPKHMQREAMVRSTKRGNAHVLVEVFLLSREQVADPGPQDGPAPPKPVRKRTKLVKHVLDEADGVVTRGGFGR